VSLNIFNINILVSVFLIFCEAKHNFWSIYAKRDSAWACVIGIDELGENRINSSDNFSSC
jgi:hypothetical protein